MGRDNISQHVSIIVVSTVICYTGANMYKLPQSILQKLKCANCDGYLRSAPIMLNNANHQLCGKCFKLIPQQEMINHRHELGLEAVAELFAFPCRYHLHGCNVTFRFNEENEHELTCPFAYTAQKPDVVENAEKLLLDAPSSPPSSAHPQDNFQSVSVTRTPECVIVMKCQNSDIYCQDSDRIKLHLDIENTVGATLVSKPMSNLHIEAIIDTESTPSITYLAAFSRNEKEKDNEYESIDQYKRDNVENTYGWNLPSTSDRSSKCVLGHDNCQYYQENSYGNVSSKSGSHCINYAKGCRTVLENTELSKHETECEYNNHKCFVNACDHTETMAGMKEHMREHHPDLLVESNQLRETLTQRDREWFLICFDSVFRCIYNYFKSEIEILVIYCGPSSEANNFRYKVKFISPANQSKFLMKRTYCLGWNTAPLDRGIQFDMKRVMDEFGMKLSKFDIFVEITKK